MSSRKLILTIGGTTTALALGVISHDASAGDRSFTIKCNNDWVCEVFDSNGNKAKKPGTSDPKDPADKKGDKILQLMNFQAIWTDPEYVDGSTNDPSNKDHGTHCWIQSGGTWYLIHC